MTCGTLGVCRGCGRKEYVNNDGVCHDCNGSIVEMIGVRFDDGGVELVCGDRILYFFESVDGFVDWLYAMLQEARNRGGGV